MIASTRFFLLLAAFILTACSKREPSPSWSDEFDYSGAPDSTRWDYDLGDGCPNVCGWGNNEWEWYTKDMKNVRVENGLLIIEAHKDSMNGKPFTSARLVSRKKGDWTYGRIEVRAKLPRGNGTWPAIWMLSTDWKYGGWPASGEIDIMEHVGNDPGVIHATVHTETFNHAKGTQREEKITVPDCMDTFHVYAAVWTEESIEMLVDGKSYYRIEHKSGEDFKTWPFDQRFHLILNLAVGGNWGAMKGVDPNIWPQRMEVDWVHVYAK